VILTVAISPPIENVLSMKITASGGWLLASG
jgi:hypothetical protein